MILQQIIIQSNYYFFEFLLIRFNLLPGHTCTPGLISRHQRSWLHQHISTEICFKKFRMILSEFYNNFLLFYFFKIKYIPLTPELLPLLRSHIFCILIYFYGFDGSHLSLYFTSNITFPRWYTFLVTSIHLVHASSINTVDAFDSVADFVGLLMLIYLLL